MDRFSAEDAIRQGWDPAMTRRAVRLFVIAAMTLAGVAAVGALALGLLGLLSSPIALVLAVVIPLAGAAATLGTVMVIRFSRLIGPLLFKFGLLVFLGAVTGLVLFVWAHGLLFNLMDGIAAEQRASAHQAATAFGGELTVEEIRLGLLPAGISEAGEPRGQGWRLLLAYALWPLQFRLLRDVLIAVAVLAFVALTASFAIWWERKVAGRIQSRLGPMRVGGWHGWAQGIADGLKLLQKEDLIPGGADRPLFKLAPYVVFVPVLSAFLALPFGAAPFGGADWAFRDLDVALLFILAMLSIDVVGVLLGGWASNNKWSMYGAMREACQMVSYEIPLGMTLLVPVMTAGTLKLTEIGNLQSGGFHTWLGLSNPFTFAAGVIYFIASLASCKRAPFDLPEAESELVAGFHTEYSGFRWAVFFFGEYGSMFVVSALATVLFFGAWYSPLPAAWGEALAQGALWQRALYGLLFSGPLWFIAKCYAFLYVQIWLRWTLPRIRIDQVMYTCVQVLLPLTMVLLLGNTVWKLLVSAGSWPDLLANGLCTLVGAGLVIGFVVIALYGFMNRRRLLGRLVVDHLPGS